MHDSLFNLTDSIIGSAISVHRELGPGLLESAYEACLDFELRARGLTVSRQVPMPLTYRGVRIDCGFRVDLLVEDRVIVEIKAVERVLPVHEAQVLSYLKLSGLTIALLLNFHVHLLRDGIQRFAV